MAEALHGPEPADAYKEVFVHGYEPAVWVWDGAGWRSATVLARYWRPGLRTRLQVHVHCGRASGVRVYAVRQPGLLPAHPGARALHPPNVPTRC